MKERRKQISEFLLNKKDEEIRLRERKNKKEREKGDGNERNLA